MAFRYYLPLYGKPTEAVRSLPWVERLQASSQLLFGSWVDPAQVPGGTDKDGRVTALPPRPDRHPPKVQTWPVPRQAEQLTQLPKSLIPPVPLQRGQTALSARMIRNILTSFRDVEFVVFHPDR